jgi:hypothetical protein
MTNEEADKLISNYKEDFPEDYVNPKYIQPNNNVEESIKYANDLLEEVKIFLTEHMYMTEEFVMNSLLYGSEGDYMFLGIIEKIKHNFLSWEDEEYDDE